MLVTYYDSYNVLTKVYGSGAYIKQAFLSTVIEEKNRPRVTKICYGVLDKDIELSYIIKSLTEKTPKLAIRTLLKIAIYSIKYLNTPPHAVTDTIVELTKKLGKGGASGFVNALIRNFVRKGVKYPDKKGVYGLSINYSYPEFLTKKLITAYGEQTAESIMAYDEEKTFIRFNKGVNGKEFLTEKNVEYIATPFSDSFEVRNFKMQEDFYLGTYTFQSVGSVAIANVLGGGDTLFDACSAPGGKAVLLADRFTSVTANELHPHRADLIRSYAERMGKLNVKVVTGDASKFNPVYENAFSAVLCDVPCSGTGVIKDNPDIKLNRTENATSELTKLQLSILTNVSKYLKSGGTLVYSTCSVLPEENDGVIKAFLENNDGYSVKEFLSPLTGVKTAYGTQFLPHISMGAGFYVCALTRK
ncbi:MAG: hypothetical protein IKL82_04760 [Clostridia bacterium]|nr:hypothetical protein [Clostridia bacterium]